VETLLIWMKGRLRIRSFLGNTENAVRIEVYAASNKYCTIAILGRKLISSTRASMK